MFCACGCEQTDTGITHIEHNPIHVFSEVSPVVCNGTYFQECMLRFAATHTQLCNQLLELNLKGAI